MKIKFEDVINENSNETKLIKYNYTLEKQTNVIVIVLACRHFSKINFSIILLQCI